MRIVFLLLSLSASILAGPIVDTNYGKVEGFGVVGKDGSRAEVFLGIPFAKPPVGELRFEKPESPEPWNDVYQATQFRNDCTPHWKPMTLASKNSGEDCLQLNIIKPKDVKEKLPVLFWIHGGGYEIGSASQHGYEVFVNNYVNQGVVVVTIQYRLGFMGFFTDGTQGAKGNWGLFDQAAALRFVKENIEHFGGDKDRITVWGYSAGAGSTTQLSLSPYTRDLFQQSIIMSGSGFVNWATGSTVVEQSIRLAEVTGCKGANLKECMKTKSVDEIFEAVDKVGETTQDIDILKWATVIDGDFIPDHPENLVKVAPPKPTIIGLSSKEASFFTTFNQCKMLGSFGLSEQEMAKVDEKYIVNVIREKILHGNRFGSRKEEVVTKIADYYLRKETDESKKTNGFYVDRYEELISDIIFNVAVVREIRSKLKQNTPIWAYEFDHTNPAIYKSYMPEEVRGSPHANEYHYLFDMPVLTEIDFEADETEKRIKDQLINMVVSFTKNGIPEVGDVDWKQVDSGKDIPYLHLTTEEVTMKRGYFEVAAAFWDGLREYGFDVVDPTTSKYQIDQEKDEL